MKNIQSIVLFLLFVPVIVNGQTGFTLLPNIANGSGHTGNMDIKIRADVINHTDTTIEVGWERIVVQMPSSWETYVCSDITCAPPSAMFGSFPLQAGDTVNLDCHFLPAGIAGMGKVILKLFPIPDTSRVILMEYNCDVELTLSQSGNSQSSDDLFVFPNPANDRVTIWSGNELKAIEIRDILGRVVIREEAQFLQREITLTSLPAGQYFLIAEEKFRKIKKVKVIQKY